jgi:hypothetical protein
VAALSNKIQRGGNATNGRLIKRRPGTRLSTEPPISQTDEKAPGRRRTKVRPRAGHGADDIIGSDCLARLEHVALQEFLDPDDETGDRQTFLATFNECYGEWKRIGQDFPVRIAEAVRNPIGSAPTAA